MPRNNTVPWTDLFPELIGATGFDMTRDSVVRKNGDRHYRVKLKLPHSKLEYVQAALKPYGFTAEKWHWWWPRRYRPGQRGEECIKCVRHIPGPRRG